MSFSLLICGNEETRVAHGRAKAKLKKSLFAINHFVPKKAKPHVSFFADFLLLESVAKPQKSESSKSDFFDRHQCHFVKKNRFNLGYFWPVNSTKNLIFFWLCLTGKIMN